MGHVRRLLLAMSLADLALLPVAVQAGSLTEYVTGLEYAVGTCLGGQTGSFAGYGSGSIGGQSNAFLSTTICHTSLANTAGATATISPGGTFTLYMRSITLVGQYTSGTVGPGIVSPLYSGSTSFCKEVYPVAAGLGPAANVPVGATSISGGTASGTLTHLGLFTAGGGCSAFAAMIAGVATLN